MKKYLLTFLCSIFILQLLNAQKSESFTHDCFSVLVGKDASSDGAVLFAHNEDDWGDRLVNWYKVPAQKNKEGGTRQLKNGGQLPIPARTWEFIWLEMPEMDFSDSYLNQWGVTIGSDACQSREENPELTEGGIGYYLRRAMAERATSAREAVKIGGALVDQFGYTASGRTYCIADTKEAWMLSVVSGKHWIAQRVPDDQVAIIPNYYTIGEIDLKDTMNFYGSADLVAYAIKNRWYDPDGNKPFNFSLVYSDEGNLENMGNIVRHWSAINQMFTKIYGIKDSFPFAFKPDKKIKLTDLFAILRNHNEGSKYDESKNYTKGNPHEQGRAICSRTTQYGFVAQLRADMPIAIGAVLWIAPFRPCVHAFTPWYYGVSSFPLGFAHDKAQSALENHFDPIKDVFTFAPESRFLQFVKHAKKVDENYGQLITSIHADLAILEAELIGQQAAFEEKMIQLYNETPMVAVKTLDEYVNEKIKKSEDLLK